MKYKKSLFRFAQSLIFLCIAATLFFCASRILERKKLYGPWNYMAKFNEFYDLEENSLNYLCIGTSHMYCTINPLEVWNSTGHTGFVLATQLQPLTASYHYLKEALKTQNPDLVVVEGYMAADESPYPSEAVAYDAIDPMKFSLNKLQLIRHIVPKENRENYYFNVLKYHSRWKEITRQELSDSFRNVKDIYKGYVCIQGDSAVMTKQTVDFEPEALPVQESNLKILEQMEQLIHTSGGQMVLMIAPVDPKETDAIRKLISLKQWAENRDIPVIDINTLYEELEIDGEEDFYDPAHLDVDGAGKVSRYFAKYLLDLNILPRKIQSSEQWERDFETYCSDLP